MTMTKRGRQRMRKEVCLFEWNVERTLVEGEVSNVFDGIKKTVRKARLTAQAAGFQLQRGQNVVE